MSNLLEQEYIPVPLNTLRADTARSFDIFIKVKKDKLVLYHSAGNLLTENDLYRLLNKRVKIIYIHKKHREAYDQYLEDNLTNILNDPDITPDQKSRIAHQSVTSIAQSLFENPRAKTITRYKTVIYSMTDQILRDEDFLNYLIRLTSFDFTTYIHSVNVGIFATGLAKILLTDETQHNIQEVASGFFLHDIGKSKIPLAILNKHGSLTDKEWEIIKKHPEEGYKLLKSMNSLSDEAKVIVLQHHERNNGKGYPNGLQGNEIHIYSKICSIADTFDALTAKRPYKKELSTFESLKIMQKEMQGEFDPHFFEQFVLLFSIK